MKFQNITFKLFSIACVACVCLVASVAVFGQVSLRESSYAEAEQDIATIWGESQNLIGPVLVFDLPQTENNEQLKKYVLPDTLLVEASLEPEIRSRGIFDTVVYTETIHVSGSFSSKDFIHSAPTTYPTLVVGLTDTRSIEKQLTLTWNDKDIEFQPSSMIDLHGDSGIHTPVPVSNSIPTYSFAFTIQLHGSDKALFTPLGKETMVSIQSPWDSPQFIGAYLPSERTVSKDGFTASWKVSSFGRNYPQTWKTGDKVSFENLHESSFGVELYQGVTPYTQVIRCVKYAVLFILVTFTALFLFDVIKNIRIHPIQYLLIGSALALFYLLLLSFSELIGFLSAYILAALLTIGLITFYSMSVLQAGARAWTICLLLTILYMYLYFVLKLEAYALLFGSLLIFGLLATVMYLTRKIDWFSSK